MIVTKQKKIEEILGFLEPYKKILVVGCDGCTQPPRSMREAETLAILVEMGSKVRGAAKKCSATTVVKQCDNQIAVSALKPQMDGYDVILSLACGVGVQVLAEILPVPVYPAQDTMFMGSQERELGTMDERCRGCGECVLYRTAGVCPVTRCAKGLMNGPCGGCFKGKCEVTEEIRDEKGNVKIISHDCAWYLIYERLKKANRLDLFRIYTPPKSRLLSTPPRQVR